MRTLVFLCAIVVIASATVPRRTNKATKLCTFCESFVNGIEEGLLAEEKDIESVSSKKTFTEVSFVFVHNSCVHLIRMFLISTPSHCVPTSAVSTNTAEFLKQENNSLFYFRLETGGKDLYERTWNFGLKSQP